MGKIKVTKVHGEPISNTWILEAHKTKGLLKMKKWVVGHKTFHYIKQDLMQQLKATISTSRPLFDPVR